MSSNGAPSITLIGNLTSDPELRFAASGQAVSNFTVACTERKYDKQAGDWVEGDTAFIRCTVWGQVAENVAETLQKGHRVVVTGNLRVRVYDTKEGGKGTSVECNVDEVGPSLKWASAKITRTGKQATQQRQTADPWVDRDAVPF